VAVPKKLDTNSVRYKFSLRFRHVAHRYARIVNDAYEGDRSTALADDDATVAAKVRQFEIAHRIKPRDWIAIGQAERAGHPDQDRAGTTSHIS
jgi:hypothetical protein